MMKKCIIAIVALSLCLGCAACKSSETPVEPPTEETIVDIPNAKHFEEFEWPTFGAATKVPTPDWSKNGEILSSSESLFWAQVGYSTMDNFNSYIEACKDSGYIENSYTAGDYLYYGETLDGYGVQITYNKYVHYIAVQVTANAEDWDKWTEHD